MGKRDVILMIHGMWCGGWVWENYRDFFEKKGFICVSPDLRFHGEHIRTPHPDLGMTSLLDYVDDLEEIILALEKQYGTLPIIMGHSMGGLLAQILASRGLAKAMILLAPATPRWINSTKPSVLAFFMPMILGTIAFWKDPLKPSYENASRNILYKLSEEERKIVYDKLCYESGRVVFEIGFWILSWWRKASKVRYKKVNCPVSIAIGGKDGVTPREAVRVNVRRYLKYSPTPNLNYREYPNHFHWLLSEPGWEMIMQDILDWLDLQRNLTNL